MNNYEDEVNSVFYNNVYFVPGLVTANPFHPLRHLTPFVSPLSDRQCASRQVEMSRQPGGTLLILGENNYCLCSPFREMLICIFPKQVMCASKGGCLPKARRTKEGGSKAGFSLLSETGINPPKGALRELSVELRTCVFMYVHVHMHTYTNTHTEHAHTTPYTYIYTCTHLCKCTHMDILAAQYDNTDFFFNIQNSLD